MTMSRQKTVLCQVCKQQMHIAETVAASMVRPALAKKIKSQHPDWNDASHICIRDLNWYREQYIYDVLETEKGELSKIEQEVVSGLKQQELLSKNLNEEFERGITLGEKVADRVAAFGGSWRFIGLFGIVLVLWIAVNSLQLQRQPFDPYPFILLNLILSCIAALQAPIIMMSQNRIEAKDRLRAENDYRTNLKAELEIQHLNIKIDQLMNHQWQRLLEIQAIQTEIMEEFFRSRPKS